MNKIITVLILISFAFTTPAFATLYWTCPNCGVRYEFDNRDTQYMNEWSAYHLSVCRGDSTTSYDSSYSTPHRPSSVQGAMLLGGLVGGVLGGVYGLAYAQPEMWSYAAGGAFLGAVAIGLLWIVSEE